MLTKHSLSRREFLELTRLDCELRPAGALRVSGKCAKHRPHARHTQRRLSGPGRWFPGDRPEGNVTVFSGKVDLGTGVRTAITQIAAEELDVSMARVNVIQGDTSLTPDQGPTYGSLSIENGGMQIRQAAATARRALVRLAARRLHVQEQELIVDQASSKPGRARDPSATATS